ncbi:MAG: type II toxin-antitoxin system RelE/ParE family toxin [Candidatus Omnitrophota bacterium]
MISLEFVETEIFTRRIVEMLPDRAYSALQMFLIKRPDAGDLVPGGRGLRKLRWALREKGKSGGLRVIYYLYLKDRRVYFVYAYKKSEQEDLTPEQLRDLALYVKGGVL